MTAQLSGTILAERYRVLHLLGGGRMGRVYAAEHVTLRRPVSVKLLRSELGLEPSKIDCFLQHVQAASSINHENVVGIRDFGTAPDGSAFLVMDYLDGEELSGVMRREPPMAWPAASHIIKQVVRGLKAAHDHGVIHGDVKPSSIFLARTPTGGMQVKLLGFGSAAQVRAGQCARTAPFTSPEQAAGLEVDARSDIYAAGVVLYQMLTGHSPFESGDGPVTPPGQLAAGIPRVVDELLMRALADEPAGRYPNMAEFEAAIESTAFECTIATSNPLRAAEVEQTIVFALDRGRQVGRAAPTPPEIEDTVIRPVTRPPPEPAPLANEPEPPPMMMTDIEPPPMMTDIEPPPMMTTELPEPSALLDYLQRSSNPPTYPPAAPSPAPLAPLRSTPIPVHPTSPPISWETGANPSTGKHSLVRPEAAETAEFDLPEIGINVPKQARSRNLHVILVAAIALLCILGGGTTWALLDGDEPIEQDVLSTALRDQPRTVAMPDVMDLPPPIAVSAPQPQTEPAPPRVELAAAEPSRGAASETPRRPRSPARKATKSDGFVKARPAIRACGREHGALTGTTLQVTFDVLGGRASSVRVQQPHSSTPLGRCIADAVSSKARFASDAPNISRGVAF